MKNQKISFIMAMLILFLGACSEDKMDEIDFNNNILVKAPLSSLLPQVSAMFICQVRLNVNEHPIIGFAAENRETTVGRNFYNEWGQTRPTWGLSFQLIRNLEYLKDEAIKQQGWGYAGIADLLKVFTVSHLIDVFGDVPYQDAVKLDIVHPKFDNAKVVFDEILVLLDKAILNLEKSGAVVFPKNEDLFFSGNMNLWIKTAYGLKARLNNRLSNLDPQGSAQKAISAIEKSFLNVNERLIWNKFVDVSGNQNPDTGPLNTVAIGNAIWNAMTYFSVNKRIEDDPRYLWFTIPVRTGVRAPAPNGIAQSDFGIDIYNGGFYSRHEAWKFRAAPAPLLTYSELLFIKAESYFRLNNKFEAYKAYQEAVRTALKEAFIYDFSKSLNDATINAYLSLPLVSPGQENLKLDDILLQKIISFEPFQNIETYNEVRRTGILPATNPRGRIHRFPYPDDEIMRNPNSPQNINIQNVFLSENKLFWAK